MAVDLGVFQRQKTLLDQKNALEQAFTARKLANAQIAGEQAKLQQAQYLDVDKLGEQSLFKAAQGLQLSPQEQAAARFVSAKTEKVQFDPTTGSRIDTPSLAGRLGLNLDKVTQPNITPPRPNPSLPNMGGTPTPSPFNSGINLPTALTTNEPPAMPPTQDPFELRFQEALNAANGNPKLQQQIRTDYLKSRISPNESEAKNAGFAQRITAAEPMLSDPDKAKASADPVQKIKAAIPLVGNYLASADYQSATQAQRDFINAVLRRESGASISPGEFDNARQQYFPQPGDKAETVTQKQANRQAALSGIEFSAGPSYKRPEKKDDLQNSFNKKKADAIQVKFLGYE